MTLLSCLIQIQSLIKIIFVLHQEEKARKEEEEAKKKAEEGARKKMILSNLSFTGYKVMTALIIKMSQRHLSEAHNTLHNMSPLVSISFSADTDWGKKTNRKRKEEEDSK